MISTGGSSRLIRPVIVRSRETILNRPLYLIVICLALAALVVTFRVVTDRTQAPVALDIPVSDQQQPEVETSGAHSADAPATRMAMPDTQPTDQSAQAMSAVPAEAVSESAAGAAAGPANTGHFDPGGPVPVYDAHLLGPGPGENPQAVSGAGPGENIPEILSPGPGETDADMSGPGPGENEPEILGPGPGEGEPEIPGPGPGENDPELPAPGAS